MNPGGMINSAAKQAGTQAAKQAGTQAAKQAGTQAASAVGTQAASALNPSVAGGLNPSIGGPTGAPLSAVNPTMSATEAANQIPQESSITPSQTPSNSFAPSMDTPSSNIESLDESLPEMPANSQGNSFNPEQLEQTIPNQGGNQAPGQQGLQPGDKVDAGKKINEEGQVEDTSTKKTVKAVGRGVAAYFSGGQSLGMDQAVTENEMGDKVIGVVSEVLEKSPGVKQAAEALDELGVPDLANDVMDVAGDIKNGDIGSAVEHGEKALKSVDKTQKKIMQRVLIGAAVGLFFSLMVFVTTFGPVIGGVMYLTEKITDIFKGVSNIIDDFFEDIELGIIENVNYQKMLDNVPGYNSLNSNRQKVLATAFTIVGSPYEWGGKPTGPGIEGVPSTGLDCSGYVKWVFWTALGSEPPFSSTGGFTDSLPELERINESELLPGDICLKRTGGSVEGNTNHVAIYAGDGNWVHAAGESSGIMVSKYKKCTVFYRHTALK